MFNKIVDKITDFLMDSNHLTHLLFGFAIGLAFGIRAGIASGIILECKDVQWNNMNWKTFDCIDMVMTMVGGVIGGLFRNFVCNSCWGSYYPIGM